MSRSQPAGPSWSDAAYGEWLGQLKLRIRDAQRKATYAVNSELVRLYWEIGQEIRARQNQQGWGAKVIDRLSQDLKLAFPEGRGFSPRNLKYMRSFAEAWPDWEIVQQVAALLPWTHHCLLLDSLHDGHLRLWYAQKTVENGWSRNVLRVQIETELHQRSGKAISNFASALPEALSDLAQESLKDPYHLDFLNLSENIREQELENALVAHVTNFLIELGSGFAFVGKQVPIQVAGEEFFLDLLFYHLRLRCYVVVELKTGTFRPEHTGQLGFYMSAVDSQVKNHDDGPTIGLLLCKKRNRIVAEYALRDFAKPIGIAEYRLGKHVPKPLPDGLPDLERLEKTLRSFVSTGTKD